jgi:hypothetical protein
MAAVDHSASQYGAVVQPTSAMPSQNPGGVVMPTPTPVLDETPTATADSAFVDTPSDQTRQSDVTPEPNNDTYDPLAQIQGLSTATSQPVPTPVSDTPEPITVDDSAKTLGFAPIESTGAGTDEELLSVKQQSLEELTPIVGELELGAEERFDILMMIIRASDDKKLVKPAFEAAHEIADNDKRARALLDIVNEVNYLTQNKPDQQNS